MKEQRLQETYMDNADTTVDRECWCNLLVKLGKTGASFLVA